MRLATTVPLFIGLACLWLSGSASSAQPQGQTPYYGPCTPAFPTGGAPPACEEECNLGIWCPDTEVDLIWEPANCSGQTGPCNRSNQQKADKKVRNCVCVMDQGGPGTECRDLGVTDEGSETVSDCTQ